MTRRLPAKVWHAWSVRRLVAAAALGLLAVAACHRAWLDIASIAIRDAENAHVLLAPLVVLWLVAVRRDRIRKSRPVAEWVGPLLVAAAAAASWVGVNEGYPALWHFAAVLALIGAACTALGAVVLWRFFPAVVAACFVVPVPAPVLAEIAMPIQIATAEVTQSVLGLIGVTAARSGNMLELDGVPVYIADGGEGLRMIFAMMLVAYAFSFGTPLRPGVRALIIALSPLAADAFNLLRLVPTVLMHAHADPGIATAFDRLAGWATMLVAFGVLVSILRVLRWAKVPLTRYSLAYD